MVILKEQLTAQSFTFIPRNDLYSKMYVIDELTNVETEVTITSDVENSYYRTITATFDLKENRFYMLELRDGTDISFRTKVFCTNQNIVTYSVNNGVYTSHSTSNEFIVYE